MARSPTLAGPFSPWEVAMPHYEFLCHACQKTFSKILALVDYEEGGILCPHCGSHNVEQRGSAFSAITPNKKSAGQLIPRRLYCPCERLTLTQDGRTLVALHTDRVHVAFAARCSLHFPSEKGVPPMYTRVVELTTKPGKARDLCTTIDDKILPILKKQAGFVDETVLASDS